MKRFLMIMLVCALLLPGCSSGNSTPRTGEVGYSHYFANYSELYTYILSEAENPVQITTDQGDVEGHQRFEDLVQHFAENGVIVPCLEDAPATLYAGNEKSDTCIIFMEQETYRQPWLWCYLEDATIRIQIMKLDDDTAAQAEELAGAALIHSIWPDSPKRAAGYWPSYQKAYEQEIQLQDRTVDALVLVSWEGEVYFKFAYDGYLIVILDRNQTISDDWLTQLSFQHCTDFE